MERKQKFGSTLQESVQQNFARVFALQQGLCSYRIARSCAAKGEVWRDFLIAPRVSNHLDACSLVGNHPVTSGDRLVPSLVRTSLPRERDSSNEHGHRVRGDWCSVCHQLQLLSSPAKVLLSGYLLRIIPRQVWMKTPRRGRSRIFECGNPAGRCHLSEGFLGDLSFPPPLYDDSQELDDAKSHPNLFTSIYLKLVCKCFKPQAMQTSLYIVTAAIKTQRGEAPAFTVDIALAMSPLTIKTSVIGLKRPVHIPHVTEWSAIGNVGVIELCFIEEERRTVTAMAARMTSPLTQRGVCSERIVALPRGLITWSHQVALTNTIGDMWDAVLVAHAITGRDKTSAIHRKRKTKAYKFIQINASLRLEVVEMLESPNSRLEYLYSHQWRKIRPSFVTNIRADINTSINRERTNMGYTVARVMASATIPARSCDLPSPPALVIRSAKFEELLLSFKGLRGSILGFAPGQLHRSFRALGAPRGYYLKRVDEETKKDASILIINPWPAGIPARAPGLVDACTRTKYGCRYRVISALTTSERTGPFSAAAGAVRRTTITPEDNAPLLHTQFMAGALAIMTTPTRNDRYLLLQSKHFALAHTLRTTVGNIYVGFKSAHLIVDCLKRKIRLGVVVERKPAPRFLASWSIIGPLAGRVSNLRIGAPAGSSPSHIGATTNELRAACFSEYCFHVKNLIKILLASIGIYREQIYVRRDSLLTSSNSYKPTCIRKGRTQTVAADVSTSIREEAFKSENAGLGSTCYS
ncbi:hypothetical protein PR048_025233 [Dryococelus australis]|uniref:Uncharacterized protein n=1 Tax=Dryococelus australis TaxID=614101 RepID=A0ABQ9GQS7_9NEOP|nr:hypothetical protein PR048_025233 [Dryococelus australis]